MTIPAKAAAIGFFLLSSATSISAQTLPPQEGPACVRYWAAVFAHPESPGLRLDAQRYQNFRQEFPNEGKDGFIAYQCNIPLPGETLLDRATHDIQITDKIREQVIREMHGSLK